MVFRDSRRTQSKRNINITIGNILSFISFNKKVNSINHAERIDISEELKNKKIESDIMDSFTYVKTLDKCTITVYNDGYYVGKC